ncbi:MAG: hypothetical protein WBE25_21815, partial [Xanthobacteraceae bacterium]
RQGGGHHLRPKLNSTEDASSGTTIELEPFSTASTQTDLIDPYRHRSFFAKLVFDLFGMKELEYERRAYAGSVS